MRYGLAFIAGILLAGCSSSSVAPPVTSGHTFNLTTSSLRPAPDSETYVLWLRFVSDSIWHGTKLGTSQFHQGEWNYSGSVSMPHSPDSIRTAYLSIEPNIGASSPSSIMLSGSITTGSGILRSDSAMGNFSNTTATATFTTRSSDTQLAKNEFYLLRFVDGISTPSATLPEAPKGWAYGLWVIDSNFYPIHHFFYGAFTNPDSADIHPTNTDFPFPGGFNAAPFDDPSAHIEVTLEPLFVVHNRPQASSPLIILEGQIPLIFNLNDTLELNNVWSPVSVTVTIQ